jgi:RNA polymerase sigma-70 factor (sigma-E family)
VTPTVGSREDDSFSAFVAADLPALLRFGYVLTGDRHRCDEVVQSALVSTYRRWAHIDSEGPHAYVRRAMVNANISLWRKTRRETPRADGLDSLSKLGVPSAYDEVDAIVRAMRKLPRRQRAVVVLRYYEDLTEIQTARILGCSTGTVKSQAARALRSLRLDLEQAADLKEGTTR